MKEDARDKMRYRLYGLLDLQKETEDLFWADEYNIHIWQLCYNLVCEGESDIDIAIYTEDFEFYKKMAVYLEQYYAKKGICSDIFYIDITMENQFMASLSISKYSLQIISHWSLLVS